MGCCMAVHQRGAITAAQDQVQALDDDVLGTRRDDRPSDTVEHEQEMNPSDEALRMKPEDGDASGAEVLRRKGIRLVSAMWLLRQGPKFRVRKLQDLPEEAFLSGELAAEYLLGDDDDPSSLPSILVLSYRWLTPAHPDPKGYHFALVRKFLVRMLVALYFNSGGELKDIGVFWDFMSLPQRPRSSAEEEIFKLGLKAINNLYGSQKHTLTLQIRADWRKFGKHPYSSSGWCRFEEAVASIAKEPGLLLAVESSEHLDTSITTYIEDALDTATRGQTQMGSPWPGDPDWEESREPFRKMGLHDVFELCEWRYYKNIRGSSVHTSAWNAFCGAMSSNRRPPMHPEDMRQLITSSEVKFTNGSDIDLVARKYEEFFNAVGGNMVEFSVPHRPISKGFYRGQQSMDTSEYAKIDWTSDDIQLFAKAMGGTDSSAGFAKCVNVSLVGLNIRSVKQAEILANAFGMMPNLEAVSLPSEKKDDDYVHVQNQAVDTDAIEHLKLALGTKATFPRDL